MRQVTLCILVKEDKVLLGMKKQGFGAGNYNGFGGKQKPGETLEQTAVRELFEEAGIRTRADCLEKKAELTFTFPHNSEWDQVVHVYIVYQWEGEPIETDEMKPEWFPILDVPYSRMWEADTYWMHHVLSKKICKCIFCL